MDFGALPPEINSARMPARVQTDDYRRRMLRNGLAAELGTTAASGESVITPADHRVVVRPRWRAQPIRLG